MANPPAVRIRRLPESGLHLILENQVWHGGFSRMSAHYHGQTCNSAQIARSTEVSKSTVRHNIDAPVVRQMPLSFANISKRQVKSPRVFIRDSGLLHRLLGISIIVDMGSSPMLGRQLGAHGPRTDLGKIRPCRPRLLVDSRRRRTRPAAGDRRTSPRVRDKAQGLRTPVCQLNSRAREPSFRCPARTATSKVCSASSRLTL